MKRKNPLRETGTGFFDAYEIYEIFDMGDMSDMGDIYDIGDIYDTSDTYDIRDTYDTYDTLDAYDLSDICAITVDGLLVRPGSAGLRLDLQKAGGLSSASNDFSQVEPRDRFPLLPLIIVL